MTLIQWFIFFLAVQIVHGLGTWKLYEKAGRRRWEAFIPVYNSIVLMKIINRPTWWTVLLFIPIINLIMFPVVWVETLRSFGRKSTADTWLGIFSFGLYLYYINYTQEVTYMADRSLVATTKTGDTISSLLFAVVVATLVHTYVMQPYTIPTSSLEKSLLIGDFLFVSKFLAVTLTVPSEKMPYHVVAGAFRLESNAANAYESLLKLGFKAKRLPANKHGLFTVLYGSYSSYSEAREAMKSIKRLDNKDAWLLIEEL